MANPVIVNLTQDVWTKVATNVTAGKVCKIDKTPGMYLETYRMTGNAAPVNISEGVPCFANSNSEIIEASSGIDVYIMARGNDGSVRVDLP